MRQFIFSWTDTMAKLGLRQKHQQRRNGRYANRRRPLRLEGLEDRRMMAVLTVSNLNDVTNGVTTSVAALVASPGADGISLREAMLAANAASDEDTVVFDPALFTNGAAAIELTQGQLVVANDLTIEGPSATLLTIDAQSNSRVLMVDIDVEATISGLTIAGGLVTGSANGGGIHNAGDLTLDSVVLKDNVAGGWGGAIYAGWPATLRLFNSTIDSNSATWGGGISGHFNSGERLYVSGSTISNNTAASGSGLMLYGLSGSSSATIVNSTVSGNVGHEAVGIRADYLGDLTILNCTITDNHATIGQGGGLMRTGGTDVTLHNTILAGNTAYWGYPDIVSWSWGTVTSNSSHNLIGDVGNSGLTHGTNGNIVIGASGDAGLAPLGDYNGPTKTHALLVDSPALDAGDNTLAGSFDQRGHARPLINMEI